jgi:hypothetical protein
MARHRILRGAVRDEVKRKILREAEDRYRNELIDDEERQPLRDQACAGIVLSRTRPTTNTATSLLSRHPFSVLSLLRHARICTSCSMTMTGKEAASKTKNGLFYNFFETLIQIRLRRATY